MVVLLDVHLPPDGKQGRHRQHGARAVLPSSGRHAEFTNDFTGFHARLARWTGLRLLTRRRRAPNDPQGHTAAVVLSLT